MLGGFKFVIYMALESKSDISIDIDDIDKKLTGLGIAGAFVLFFGR